MKIIITAGGQGTKIWPFSRKDKPKQFQKIIGEQSLFTHNVQMLLNKFEPQDLYVSTKKMYVDIVKGQAPSIPVKNVIVEPDHANGRGPAEGFAFLILSVRYPNEPFMLVQADCLYLPTEKFLTTVDAMDIIVRRDRKFITGGHEPNFPVLGVDYLSLGEKVEANSDIEFYQVREFLDRKKGYQETLKMIEQKNAVIHTNLSCWFPDLMLNAYKKYKPDWYKALMEIKKVLDEEQEIDRIYSEMVFGSTEEVTRHVLEEGYAVMYSFKWVDIGTWDSVYEHLSSDKGVYKEGNIIALDSSGSLVKSANKDKLVAVLGLEDMVVVDTDDILFIAPRDKVGKVGDIQKELKEQGLDSFL